MLSQKLNYKVLGKGTPIIILHGLFGTLDNWITIAKLLADRQFKVYLVDQRNHGKSPHFDTHNYEVMSEDLYTFMEQQQLNKAILIGHSMGGKTAMTFAVNHPHKVAKLIVVDIAPKYYPPHHKQIFAALHGIDVDSVKSRKEADDRMKEFLESPGVRQFLLKNMERLSDGKFSWKMNLPVLEEQIDEIGKGLEKDDSFEGETYFIAGSESDYIQRGDRADIISHFPQAKIATIKGSGHWIHAEKTEQFVDVLLTMLHG